MIRHQKESLWPFLCVLACLFVLSVTSPRAWERVARKQAIDKLLLGSTDRTKSPPVELEATSGRTPDATPVDELPPAPTAEPERPVSELPLPTQASGAVDELCLINPAEKLAGCPIELDLPEAELPPLVSEKHQPQAAPHEDLLPPPADASPEVASPEQAVPEEASPKKAVPASQDSPRVANLPSVADPSQLGATPSPDDIPETPAVVPAEEPRVEKKPAPERSCPAWKKPEKLLVDLEELARECETGEWAMEASRRINALGSAVSSGSDEVVVLLGQLDASVGEAGELAGRLGESPLKARLLRARYALRRRVDVWKQATLAGGLTLTTTRKSRPDPEKLLLALADVDALTARSPRGSAWRSYLLLDALQAAAERPEPARDHQRLQLARRVMERLARARLDADQRRFLTTGPLAALGWELRQWALEPVDLGQLLRDMERYEQTRLPSDARVLAEDRLQLEISRLPERRRLGNLLDAHYRNANIRLALTVELLNRLIPEREPEHARVRDTVLGLPVWGRSRTSTDVAVRLIPDPSRLLLALEVTGEVASDTSSTSGPATFHNRSRSIYTARKPIEIGTWGIRVWPAEVDVRNATRLRSLDTDFDVVPLVGALVRGVARSQHEQKRPQVRCEIKQKVAAKAKQRVDTEADARFGELSDRLKRHVLQPMADLSLGPEMVSAHTTERRIVMRLRLAGKGQLGGHTPRPRAPSDSLASFQVHQSAINNAVEKLELDGGTFTLPELRRRIATRLGRAETAETKTSHDDVEITFAKDDAVRVECGDGRMTVTLSVVELSKPPRHWRDFQVRAFYQPDADGPTARLARDGIIHLIGKRLSTGSQIAVRGVFSKVFSKYRPWRLTPDRLANDPKLADLVVVQFVIDDGWIGVALGPRRIAERPAVAKR